MIEGLVEPGEIVGALDDPGFAASEGSPGEDEDPAVDKQDVCADADVCDPPHEEPEAAGPAERISEPKSFYDDVARLLAAPDCRTFLGGLIGVLASPALAGTSADRGLASLLRLLGRVLGAGFDEERALEEVVDAIGRGHSRSEELVVVGAALIARVAAGSTLRSRPSPSLAEAGALVAAAARVMREALDGGDARSRGLLPHVASTIARRNARRNLPIAALAAALPRVWAQQGTHGSSAAATDRPAPGLPAGPQLMVLNGPVEIVILGR